MEFINIKTCIIRLRNLIMHVFIKVLSYKLHDSTKIKDHSKSIADSILIFAGKLASCLFFWSLYCNTSVFTFRSTNRINRSCSDSSQAADAECFYSSFSRATGEKSMLYSLYCVSNQRCLFKTYSWGFQKSHCRAAMERLPMNDPLTIVFYQQWVMLQIHSDSDKALLRKRRNFTTIDFIEYRKLRSTLHSRLWRLVSFSFSFRLQFAQEKLWSLSCSFHLNRSTSYWNNSLFKTIP